MLRAGLTVIGLIAVIVTVAGLWLTRAIPLPPEATAGLTGDAARGEPVFWAAGCASCHVAPDAEDALLLSGGQSFASPFGTFRAPNVSPDPDHGIGDWTLAQFASAVQRGVSPDGSHYFPAFPYAAYTLADPQDIADLWAFWATLPPSGAESLPHDLAFPFNLRRGVGVWKRLYVPDDFTRAETGPQVARGRYLVEALAHCAECHTPRDALGGLDRDRWMAGAPDPSGRGRVPGLTPATLDWSEADIAAYLRDGFTPDFDSVGGHMTAVVANMARLTDADRAAIAAYLKALPPRP